ncbi:hypothetical protein H8J86_08130 [Clostridium perfringens]|uniref:hypothetical protein n=1 Tax=Clostridium perfringens TaxID=1502 RepID=UPI0018E40FD1|nr:hypothetical protein [Clostridium perfringens]MBI6005920.1 hypothetical protein [Clostridium perfringens]
MKDKEKYNKVMEQFNKLTYKLAELCFNENNIKIQMSRETNFLIGLNIYNHSPNFIKEFNRMRGFNVEIDNNLSIWEVNVKFQDILKANQDGTTTRIINYINLDDIDNLKYVPNWGMF